jgi:3',5'-cyclic AMP phosphodiesterase CpdA
MRVIAHLSDLHFGRIDPEVLEPLRRRLHALAPDLLVVSGDLTQRAKPAEFRSARAYLDTLPKPQIVVPGNHDIPLYNVLQRFFSPLRKYRRFIASELEPAYIDDEIAVVGVNTARSLVFKGGRINEEQVERVRRRICNVPDRVTKIIVTHHPFDMPDDWDDQHQVAGRAAMALKALAQCGADVYVSGHMHKSHSGEPSLPIDLGGFNALMVSAGTATSTRGRGERNSFNTLRVTPDHIVVEHHEWDEKTKSFDLRKRQNYRFTDKGWVAGIEVEEPPPKPQQR